MIFLAEGFGTGEAALTGLGFVGLLLTVAGFLIREKIKQFDETARRVAKHETDLALVKQNREACAALEARVAVLETQNAVTTSYQLRERVQRLEDGMKEILSDLRIIRLWVENQSGRFSIKDHPKRRHDDPQEGAP